MDIRRVVARAQLHRYQTDELLDVWTARSFGCLVESHISPSCDTLAIVESTVDAVVDRAQKNYKVMTVRRSIGILPVTDGKNTGQPSPRVDGTMPGAIGNLCYLIASALNNRLR